MFKKSIALLLLLTICFTGVSYSAGANSYWSISGSDFLKSPYLLYPNDNTTMTVMWQTTSTVVSKIEWGTTPSYGAQAIVTESGGGSYQHQFSYTMTGLSPSSTIYYRVTAGSSSATGSFLAAANASVNELTFYAYGDNRDGVNDQENVLSHLLADMDKDPAHCQTFCLHAGDMTRFGEDEQFWVHFFPQVTDPSEIDFPSTVRFLGSMPVLMSIGNHETYDVNGIIPVFPGDILRKYWPFTYYGQSNRSYYSFDYGPVHVTVLDQYADSGAYVVRGSAQYNWMVNDLASTTKPWKIVMFHEPAWTADTASSHAKKIQDVLCPIFKANGVKLVIQGHTHFYARCNPPDGLTYLVLGGGGAMLGDPDASAPHVSHCAKAFHFARFDISGNMMKVTVTDDSGKVIETFIQGQFAYASSPENVKVYPNPFNSKLNSLNIVNLTGSANIKIYNVAGELIRTLDYSTGNSKATWDGKNDSGSLVASGIYIIHIKSDSGSKTIKVAVEK